MSKMRAAVCYKPGELRVEDVPKPEPARGQAVVKIKVSGVCGSDVDGYLGTHPWIDYPIILGHECSGIVESVGEGVEKFKPGDSVVVEPFFVCGRCPNCLRGRYNMCRDIIIIGHQVPGSFAEYVLMNERFLHTKPESISFEAAALAEPVSGALHAVGRCNLHIGDFVVLLGCGTIGYFAAQHVLNSGARLLVSEPDARKRGKAASMGARWTVDPARESVLDKVMELTDGVGADCVIEAVGSPDTIKQTIALGRKGGTVMLIGWTGNQTDPFDTTTLTLDEMTVLGTMGFAWDFPVTLDLLACGKIDAESIVTHRFPLERCKEALQILHEKRDGIWKAVLVFD